MSASRLAVSLVAASLGRRLLASIGVGVGRGLARVAVTLTMGKTPALACWACAGLHSRLSSGMASAKAGVKGCALKAVMMICESGDAKKCFDGLAACVCKVQVQIEPVAVFERCIQVHQRDLVAARVAQPGRGLGGQLNPRHVHAAQTVGIGGQLVGLLHAIGAVRQ